MRSLDLRHSLSKMAPSLDPFPDLCLIAIFMHLPLSDLLAVVGLVCGRWRLLLPTVLARRRSLKIVQTDLAVERFEPDYQYGGELIYKVLRDDGSPWLVRSKVDNQNVVVVPNIAPPHILTELFTNGLMDSLPNIANLTIIQSDVDANLLPQVLTQVIRMLDQWQDKLVSLTLSVRYDHIFAFSEERLIRNLVESINRLGSLRHLKIELDFPWANSYEPELYIFSQLNSLAFSAQIYHQNWLIRSINQYANPNVVAQISFDAYFDLNEYVQISPKLAAKFCLVRRSGMIIDEQDDLEDVEIFCSRFISVRYLHLVLTGNSLRTIFSNLAQLQHLVHLQLILISCNFNPHELTPIRSVRLLTITVSTRSHQNLESFRLSFLFPNVQVLQMRHTSTVCRDCDYDGWDSIKDQPEVWPIIHECKQMARQALTRFPNLHTIRLQQYPGTSDGTFTDCDTINSLEQL